MKNKGPMDEDYDIDVGPILCNDWYHTNYNTLDAEILSSPPPPGPPEPLTDNNLINGKMNFNCTGAPSASNCTDNAGLSKFKFEAGKTHLLRLVNSGVQASQIFSIDDHMMTVI